MSLLEESARTVRATVGGSELDELLDAIDTRYAEVWQAEAGLKTYGEAVADALEQRLSEGELFDMTLDEWRSFAAGASFSEVRAKADTLDIRVTWDPELPKTPDGYYQVQGGIDYAIAKSLAAAPFADLLWMETKTADLEDARRFAEAIHAEYPDKMLAYNLSPSFNWDTTGLSDDEMRRFPEDLGRLGFVFNFITYGGHQIDGLAAEEFATALREDGMLALARLQRKFRLLESPYRTPQSLVGGDRLDAALMAASGRTAATKAMGKGSTQHQHLVQTEVPTRLLEEWLAAWATHWERPANIRVELRPHTAGSDLLEIQSPRRLRRSPRKRDLCQHRRPPGPEHPLDPRSEHGLVNPAAAPDDVRPAVPDPPLSRQLPPLSDAHGGQQVADAAHAGAGHLLGRPDRDRPDHRRGRQPRARRRVAPT